MPTMTTARPFEAIHNEQQLQQFYELAPDDTDLMETAAREVYFKLVYRIFEQSEQDETLRFACAFKASLMPVVRWDLLPRWFVMHYGEMREPKNIGRPDDRRTRIARLIRHLRAEGVKGDG